MIAEASTRFALPRGWIAGVMRRESAFDSHAVSTAGALGLMQIMPRTYADLRLRYGLGADPLQPHDNILAGAAYLRELYDRFGAGGFLAAYNAGPSRYLRTLTDGSPLPGETWRYTRQLTADLGLAAAPVAAPAPSVFVATSSSTPPSPTGLTPNAVGLFAPISAAGRELSHGQ